MCIVHLKVANMYNKMKQSVSNFEMRLSNQNKTLKQILQHALSQYSKINLKKGKNQETFGDLLFKNDEQVR